MKLINGVNKTFCAHNTYTHTQKHIYAYRYKKGDTQLPSKSPPFSFSFPCQLYIHCDITIMANELTCTSFALVGREKFTRDCIGVQKYKRK